MDSKKLPVFQSKLEDIRASLLGHVVKSLKSSQEEGAEPLADISDGAAQAYNRQLQRDLGEQDWNKLKMVEEALEKIESGDYGICSQCEEDMPEARLEVVPFAKYCVLCLNEIEKQNEIESAAKVNQEIPK